MEIEKHVPEIDNDWRPMDFWKGMLFLFVGLAFLKIFLNLVNSDDPIAWVIIGIGGFGWLSVPLFLMLGGNACFQSIRSIWR